MQQKQGSKVTGIKILELFIHQNLNFIDFSTMFSVKILPREVLFLVHSQNGDPIFY